MLRKRLFVFAIIVLQPWSAMTVWASDETPTYDRIDLSSTAYTQVENDTIVAVLYIQREGTEVPLLVNEVNNAITQAVQQSQKTPSIAIQTLSYRTDPIYDKQRLSRWRVRQSIRLEGQDSEKLSQLIGNLQRILAVESINYTVSTDKMREVEDKLISEAIEGFTQRAKLITHQFGYSDYRLVNININTVGAPLHSTRGRSVMMAMESVTSPTIEAGKQKVKITVSGTIQMQLK